MRKEGCGFSYLWGWSLRGIHPLLLPTTTWHCPACIPRGLSWTQVPGVTLTPEDRTLCLEQKFTWRFPFQLFLIGEEV